MTPDSDAIDMNDLAVHGVLNLAVAPALTERLLERRGRDLCIDAGGVEHLGASCAQVLMSAFKTWQVDGHAIALRNPSDGFRESVRLLGLTDLLDGEA